MATPQQRSDARRPLPPIAMAVALVALLALAAVLSVANPGLAGAQAPSSTTYLSPPVVPLAVTVAPAALASPPSAPVVVPEGEPLPSVPASPQQPVPDPVIQGGGEVTALEVSAPGAISALDVDIAGITTGCCPSDTVMDVGRDHVVQMVNSTLFQVWDKAGNSLLGPANFGNLWPVGNQCRRNDGDPIVVYDHLADRWLLSQFRNGGPAPGGAGDNVFLMCIAISQTPDPTAGTWFLYNFNTQVFPDYPKIAVWPDGYYMSSFEQANLGIYVFDRANMLLGNAAASMKTTISSLTPAAGVRETRILPGDLDGPPPPDGTPNFFVRTVDDQQDTANPADRIEVYEARVNWLAPSFTFPLVDTLTPAAFQLLTCNRTGASANNAARDCIPQPDTAQNVDALSNRPMMQLKYRNFGSHQAMVFNQTIDVRGSIMGLLGFAPANDVAGVRWYELRKPGANWAIQQQGTYAPQPNGATTEAQLLHRWMGSMAMDKDGNIALGYSISNENDTNGQEVFPGIRYTGRRFDDVPGLLPQGEQVMFNGTISQVGDGVDVVRDADFRWGDYSAMSVDPVDDCTFWYTTHLAATNPATPGGSTVATRIASFRFNTCGTDLAIQKNASPAPATAGEQLIYTVTVTNNGPAEATNVTVVDTLPAGVTFVTDTDSCVQGPAGTLTCSLGSLASGASVSFQIKVLIGSGVTVPGGPTTITNTAIVGADQADLDPTNDQVSVTTIVEERADLQITKQCKPDGPAPAGGTGTCTIFVDNLGPSDARNVVVTDTHLSNGSFTITSATASPGGPCAIAGGVVTCNLGTEPAGGRTTITVTITSDDAVDVNDTATVTSTTPDPNTANNQATGSVNFQGSADLSVTKTDSPDPVTAGTNLTYTITVTNSGPSAASNVVLQDILPAEVSVVSATPSQGSCSGTTVPGDPLQPLTCNLGALADTASATVTLVVTVKANTPNGTILINNASVSSAVSDPNNGNNNVTSSTTVQTRADLAITKTSDKAIYKPSSLITYTITVQNIGPSDALAVVVTDNLPTTRQAIYLSDTGGCTKSGLTLTCSLGYMAVGESRTFNINLTVKGSRGSVSNTASVASTGVTPTMDPVPGNNTAVRVVTIGK